MVGMRKIALLGGLGALVLGFAACTSPMLTRIKQEISKAIGQDTNYAFARQFGNPAPQWTFNPTLVVKVDTAGYVYTTDSSFRLNKYSSAGAIQRTINIVSGASFSSGVNDMAFDAAGNMFVTTTTGTVQKYSLTGSLLLQFGSLGTGNGQFSSPEGIAVDSSGNIYVADSPSGNNRIQKFDSAGNYLDQWPGMGKNSTGTAFSFPYGLVIAGGNLYVVDEGNSVIKEYTTAGNFVASFAGPGATNGLLSNPRSIAKDSSGNFYVADTGNSRIQVFNSSFIYSTQWTAGFSSPNSVAVDASGNVYVTDGSGNRGRIQKFNSTGTSVLATFGGDDRSLAGYVSMPTGVAYDSSGNIYVADNLNLRVQKFDAAGNYLQSFAGFGFSTYPLGMAADKSGNVYVPDPGNSQVKKIDASGTVTPIITSGSGDGFVTTPAAVAVDSSGMIYVVDLNDQRLQVFDSSGYWQSRKYIYAGNGPLGMAVDATGNIYVSAYLDNHLDKLAPDGTLLAQWGSSGSAAGQFNVPIGVAIDSGGYILVVDMLNRRIQKFDTAGNVVHSFGTAGMGSGGFGWPVGIGLNAAGLVVISDYKGCLIQEFTPVLPSY